MSSSRLCGVNAASTSSGRPCGDWFIGSACHTKKDLRASEQKRPDVAKDRAIWKARRQPFMRDHLECLVFIDETSLKTNMINAAGWAAPFKCNDEMLNDKFAATGGVLFGGNGVALNLGQKAEAKGRTVMRVADPAKKASED